MGKSSGKEGKSKTKVPVAKAGKSVDKKIKKNKAKPEVVAKPVVEQTPSKSKPSKTKSKTGGDVSKTKKEKSENKAAKIAVSCAPFVVF